MPVSISFKHNFNISQTPLWLRISFCISIFFWLLQDVVEWKYWETIIRCLGWFCCCNKFLVCVRHKWTLYQSTKSPSMETLIQLDFSPEIVVHDQWSSRSASESFVSISGPEDAKVRWARPKSAERALEKLYRSYDCDVSRLLDCCRQVGICFKA